MYSWREMAMSDYLFFVKERRHSLRGAYEYFGVRDGSYLGSVVERIYDYYCKGAVNLFREYRRYYKNEFENYTVFLEKKYNLYPEDIDKVNSRKLCCKDLSLQPDVNIRNLLEDEIMLKTLKGFLGGEK